MRPSGSKQPLVPVHRRAAERRRLAGQPGGIRRLLPKRHLPRAQWRREPTTPPPPPTASLGAHTRRNAAEGGSLTQQSTAPPQNTPLQASPPYSPCRGASQQSAGRAQAPTCPPPPTPARANICSALLANERPRRGGRRCAATSVEGACHGAMMDWHLVAVRGAENWTAPDDMIHPCAPD